MSEGPTADDASKSPDSGLIFSFVVDYDPRFSYQGYHLARSLLRHGAMPASINVHFTPEVSERSRRPFAELGCRLYEVARFADGRHANKIAQLQNLSNLDFTAAVLLDTDMIVVATPWPMVDLDVIQAKVVDAANPSLAALETIASAAKLPTLPAQVATDDGRGVTYFGNCNGGLYVVPKRLVVPLSTEWRRWALWLLDHIEPLRRERKEAHLDQVSFWLSICAACLPCRLAPSNLNYFIHYESRHEYLDPAQPIAVLHYHHRTMSRGGLIEPAIGLSDAERAAVESANMMIRSERDPHLLLALENDPVLRGARQ